MTHDRVGPRVHQLQSYIPSGKSAQLHSSRVHFTWAQQNKDKPLMTVSIPRFCKVTLFGAKSDQHVRVPGSSKMGSVCSIPKRLHSACNFSLSLFCASFCKLELLTRISEWNHWYSSSSREDKERDAAKESLVLQWIQNLHLQNETCVATHDCAHSITCGWQVCSQSMLM